MSWSASLQGPKPADEIDADSFTLSPAELDEGPREQFELAVAKAKSIASSGSVGDSAKRFHVSLSGHANPDHEPAAGWANDMISVSVSQAS